MSMNKNLLFFLLCATSLVTSGCGGLFGVTVTPHKTVATPPSHVLIYVSVEHNGEPVDHLGPSHFKLYENDVLLDKKAIHLRMLSRDEVADGHTALLLDLSGELAPEELSQLQTAAKHFVEKVTTTQSVTVFAYDGSRDLRLVERYSRVERSQKRPVPDLSPFVTGDSSRNLNGAVLQAIEKLEEEMADSDKPVKLGTVVTLARGADLAGYEGDDQLYEALEQSNYEFYAIGPEEAEIPTWQALGKDGRIRYESMETAPLRMMDLGMRVRSAWGRHYVLIYCSPARNGTREVKIRVRFFDDDGDEKLGGAKTQFSAEGFTSGCGTSTADVKAQEPK